MLLATISLYQIGVSMKVRLSLAFILIITFNLFSNETDLKIKVSTEFKKYEVGDTVSFALTINIPKNYHLYSNPLGPGIGKPLSLSFSNSDFFDILEAKKENPKKFIPKGMETDWTWAWENEAHLFVKAIIQKEINNSASITANISGLICKTDCLPISKDITLSTSIGLREEYSVPFNSEKISNIYNSATPLNIEKSSPISNEQESSISSFSMNLAPSTQEYVPQWSFSPKEAGKRDYNIFLAIILAFIAGVILNFMPCVLPVLGIKILSFSKGREGSKKEAIYHSLSFAAGMILVFFILATLAAFAGMSWGEQFQNPIFIVALVSMMFLFGLGMFDLFIILVPSKISEMDAKQESKGFLGNFTKGIFATILATPCSGPFLGATLAWTLTQPKLIIYLVFLFLGLGMAAPYILLAASKRLSRIIPKPGAWMEDFKHILGFFLFGFAIYLMMGLPTDWVLPTVSFLGFLSFIVIFYERIAPFGSSITKKITAIILSLLILFAGYHISFKIIYANLSDTHASNLESHSSVTWHQFNIEEFEGILSEERDVIIDFTASWCMNCQYNKINVYHSKEMEELIKNKNIYAIKADLTVNNPQAEKLLNDLGSKSVPFFAIFPSTDPENPIIMRDILSKKKVMEELNKLTDG